MNDLMLAAKAAKVAGLDVEFDAESGKAFDHLSNEWDPRLHDGEALRLAGALLIGLDLAGQKPAAVFFHPGKARFVRFSEGPDVQGLMPAIRMAIFRSAVEIARFLP